MSSITSGQAPPDGDEMSTSGMMDDLLKQIMKNTTKRSSDDNLAQGDDYLKSAYLQLLY